MSPTGTLAAIKPFPSCSDAAHEKIKANPVLWAACVRVGVTEYRDEDTGEVFAIVEQRNCACGATLAIDLRV